MNSPLQNISGDATDGRIDVRFTLYDQQTLGAAVWTETHPDVAVDNGLFSVLLGSVTTPLDTTAIAASANVNRWLQVEVSRDNGLNWEALDPRKDLVSVAYAIQAQNADTVDGKHASDFVQDWTGLLNTGTVPADFQDGQIVWAEIPDVPPFLTEEVDPQVGLDPNMDANYVPSWDATSLNEVGEPGMLVKGTIYDNRAAGRIGIGTATPSDSVDVQGGGLRVVQTQIKDNAGNGEINRQDGTSLVLGGGATAKTILQPTAGNVGIGTATPDAAAKLEVAGQIKISDASKGDGKVLTSDANGLATWKTAPATGVSDWDDLLATGTVPADFQDGQITWVEIPDVPPFLTEEVDPQVGLDMTANYVPSWDATSLNEVGDAGMLVKGTIYDDRVNGWIGIGTANPEQTVDVNGAIRVTGTAAADSTPDAEGLVEFDAASGDLRLVAQNSDTVRGGVRIATQEKDGGGAIVPVEVNPNGDVLLAQSLGNVGVGTATPRAQMEVYSAVDGTGPLLLSSPSPDLYFETTDNAKYNWRIAAQEDVDQGLTFGVGEVPSANAVSDTYMALVTIKQNGRVGIGTDNPDAKLDVNGQVKIRGGSPEAGKVLTSSDAEGLASWQAASDVFEEMDPQVDENIADKYVPRWDDGANSGNGALVQGVIYDNGNVGIGTDDPGAKLEVNGTVKVTDGTQADGYVLTSDPNGLASWKPAAAGGIIKEIDPQVDDMVNNYVPSWDAAIQNDAGEAGALVKGTIYDNRANGHVGIGTANPETIFHHVGRDSAGSVSQVTRISDSGAGATINREIARVAGVDAAMEEATGNGTVNWYSGGNLSTPRLTLAPNGDLGIGVSPSYPLHVARSTPGYVAALQNAYNGAALYFGYGGGQGAVIEVGSGDDALAFQVSKNWNALLTVRGDPDSVGNVGVGIVNPSAKLHVNGQIKITDGTEGSGKVLTSGADGLASWQAVPTAVASGWTDEGTVVRLTTSSDNVGVGTTTPSEKLDVQGGKLRVENTIIYDNEIYRHDTAGNKDLYVGSRTTANTILQSSGGNVGVGVYPGYPFHVYRDTADWLVRLKNANAGGAEVYLAHGGGYGAIIEAGADASAGTYALHVQQGGTAFFTVKGDGKTGIGTASPQAPLHHVGRATAGGYSDVTRVSDSGGGAGANREIYSVGGSALSAVETLPSGNMNFYSGGNASTPTLALNADGTVEAKRGDYRFQGLLDPFTGRRQFLALQGYTAPEYTPKTVVVPAAKGFRVTNPGNTAPLLDLREDGSLWVLAGYSSGSDERMKFYPTTLDYGLSTVKLLQPKKYFRADYTYNAETGDIVFDPDSVTNDIGLVAQDVYPLIPEAVHKPQDENKEIWSLEYDKFIPVIIKAVQELAEQIETLQPQATLSEDLQKTVEEQQQQIALQQQTITDLVKRVEALENK